MNGFSLNNTDFTLNFIDFDRNNTDEIVNEIKITNKDIGIEEIRLLYNYLTTVYETVDNKDSLDIAITLQNNKRKILYDVSYVNNILYISMGLVYDVEKPYDIVALKTFMSYLDKTKNKNDINKIFLDKHDKIIFFEKNKIDVEKLKEVLNALIDYPFYGKQADVKRGIRPEDYRDLIYIIGTSSGKAEFFLENFSSNYRNVIINNKIEYYMSENNIEKLYKLITVLFSIIEKYNNENNTILENFDRDCESNEDPITSEEWD